MKLERWDLVAWGSAWSDDDGDWCKSEDVAELEALNAEMLDIIELLHHCSDYWSEYYVPIGIVERMNNVKAQAKGDNHDQR